MFVRVKKIKPMKSCTGKVLHTEMILSAPFDAALVDRLSRGGQAMIYADLPKPLFRIEKNGHYVIQGVLGSDTCRVSTPPQADANLWRNLRAAIEAAA